MILTVSKADNASRESAGLVARGRIVANLADWLLTVTLLTTAPMACAPLHITLKDRSEVSTAVFDLHAELVSGLERLCSARESGQGRDGEELGEVHLE